MPKINVYVSDELAAAVREAELPISSICQKALADAVRLVARARRAVALLRDPNFDPRSAAGFGSRIEDRMTPRLRRAVQLAQTTSESAGRVETKHLLIGLLDEGGNLAVRVLQALEVDTAELRDAAARQESTEEAPTAPVGPDEAASSRGGFPWNELSLPARRAVASTLEASIDLGHNYLGGEHLLLGLLDGEASVAAQLLQQFGVRRDDARRALLAAVAGFTHAKAETGQVDHARLDEIVRRLEAVESRLAAGA